MNFTRSSSDTITSFQATLANAGYGQLVLRDAIGKVSQKWTLAQPKCIIGTAANCTIRCLLPGISDHHVLMIVGAKQLFLRSMSPGLAVSGKATQETVISHDPSQENLAEIEFEIAGHRFQYSRQNIKTPIARPLPSGSEVLLAGAHAETPLAAQTLRPNGSTERMVSTPGWSQPTAPITNQLPTNQLPTNRPTTNRPTTNQPTVALAENVQSAPPSMGERMRFTFVRALEKSRQAATGEDVGSSASDVTKPMWVEEIVRDALRPVESQLEEIAAPIQNLERQLKKAQARQRKASKLRRQKQQVESAAQKQQLQQMQLPSREILEAQESIQRIVADQANRLNEVSEHVTEIVSQIATIERIIAEESGQHQEIVNSTHRSGEEIMRLQREMLQLVANLQSQIAAPASTRSDELQWRASVEKQLEELHTSLAVLNEIKSDLHQAIDQNRELTQEWESHWQTIEEVARRPVVIQQTVTPPAPAAEPARSERESSPSDAPTVYVPPTICFDPSTFRNETNVAAIVSQPQSWEQVTPATASAVAPAAPVFEAYHYAALQFQPDIRDDEGLEAVATPASPVPASPVPASPVPASPVPASPVPASPASSNPAAMDPVIGSATPIAQMPLAQMPVAQLPVASAPHAQVPMPQVPISQMPIAHVPMASMPMASTPASSMPMAQARADYAMPAESSTSSPAMGSAWHPTGPAIPLAQLPNMPVVLPASASAVPEVIVEKHATELPAWWQDDPVQSNPSSISGSASHSTPVDGRQGASGNYFANFPSENRGDYQHLQDSSIPSNDVSPSNQFDSYTPDDYAVSAFSQEQLAIEPIDPSGANASAYETPGAYGFNANDHNDYRVTDSQAPADPYDPSAHLPAHPSPVDSPSAYQSVQHYESAQFDPTQFESTQYDSAQYRPSQYQPSPIESSPVESSPYDASQQYVSQHDDSAQYDSAQYDSAQYDSDQYDPSRYDSAQYGGASYQSPAGMEDQYERPSKSGMDAAMPRDNYLSPYYGEEDADARDSMAEYPADDLNSNGFGGSGYSDPNAVPLVDSAYDAGEYDPHALDQPAEMPTNYDRHELPTDYDTEAVRAARDQATRPIDGSDNATVAASEAAQPATSGEEGGDESVEDYMRRLLARMRGVSESEVTLPGLDAAANRPKVPVSPPNPSVDRSAVEPAQTEPLSEAWTEPFDPEKYVPRGAAPEKNRDLNALRELANTSARSAIQVSARRRQGSAVLIKSAVALVGLIAGVAIVSINGARINIAFIATVASFLVAAIWGYDALTSLRPLVKDMKAPTPKETASRAE